MVNWINNFFVPIFQLVFYIAFFGTLLFFILRAIYRIFNRRTRWFFKYKFPFLKKPYDEKDVIWCMKAYEKEMNEIQVKMFLLIKGTKPLRIKEMLYIYKQILKQLKGGNPNGRQFKGHDSKTETISDI